jgi:hypothetical protein
MGAPDGGVRLRVPSPRTTALLHVLAIAILVAVTIYWIGQPCTTDFIASCGFLIGVTAGAVALVLSVGLLLHATADRSGLLVLGDALILSVTLQLLVPTSLDPEIVAFSLLALVVLAGIPGAIANLLDHRAESVLVAILLALEALWLGVLGLVPAVVAAVLVVILVRRGWRSHAPPAPVPPATGGATS